MYSLVFHQDVIKDFKELGHSTALLVHKKLKKIADNPFLGIELGNKANLDLTGYRKIYVDNKRVRIVYKIIDSKIEVFVIAVGKRDSMNVYQKASNRTGE